MLLAPFVESHRRLMHLGHQLRRQSFVQLLSPYVCLCRCLILQGTDLIIMGSARNHRP